MPDVQPGEPVFTIVAHDALAPAAVEAWASMAEIAAAATGVHALAVKAEGARQIARDMRSWQAAYPDQVSWPS